MKKIHTEASNEADNRDAMDTIAIVFAKTLEHEPVYLTDYAAADKNGVVTKIMNKARAEGFRGTIDARLAELNWEIVCVRLEQVSQDPTTNCGI